MDYSHAIIAACREGRLGFIENTERPIELVDGHRVTAHIKELSSFVGRAQKFDFFQLRKTFSPELYDTAWDVAAAGLLALPYDVSFFNLRTWKDGQVECALVTKAGESPWDFGSRGADVAITIVPIWCFKGSWVLNGTIIGVPFGGSLEFTIGAVPGFAINSAKDIHPEFRQATTQAAGAVMQALICLQAKGIKLERVEPSALMNKIRKSKGKPPQVEHSVVVIDPDRVVREPAEGGSTHASPRMHWRRGHVRRAHTLTLASGQVIQRPASIIPACIVGDPKAGWVEHDYEVR